MQRLVMIGEREALGTVVSVWPDHLDVEPLGEARPIRSQEGIEGIVDRDDGYHADAVAEFLGHEDRAKGFRRRQHRAVFLGCADAEASARSERARVDRVARLHEPEAEKDLGDHLGLPHGVTVAFGGDEEDELDRLRLRTRRVSLPLLVDGVLVATDGRAAVPPEADVLDGLLGLGVGVVRELHRGRIRRQRSRIGLTAQRHHPGGQDHQGQA